MVNSSSKWLTSPASDAITKTGVITVIINQKMLIRHLKACSTEDCGPLLEGRMSMLDLDLEDLDLEKAGCGKPGPWRVASPDPPSHPRPAILKTFINSTRKVRWFKMHFFCIFWALFRSGQCSLDIYMDFIKGFRLASEWVGQLSWAMLK